MRTSRKIRVIVGIVVLAVALGFVVSNYLEAAAEHNRLDDRLGVAQSRLPALVGEHEDLEERLEIAEAALARSQRRFAGSLQSLEYGEDLCKAARDSGVRITSLTASSPSDRTGGTITYSVATFTMSVSGDVRDILEFAHTLRSARDFQLPWSAQVRGVSINYSARTATISFDVYGYKG